MSLSRDRESRTAAVSNALRIAGSREGTEAGGTGIAIQPSVKSILVVLFALALVPASIGSADSYGSKWRKEYEGEKNGPHGECRTSWTTLRDGLDHRRITCLGSQKDLDVHVVRIDPDKFDLNTTVMRAETARGVAGHKDASFVINANFFDKARTPLGIVVRSGSLVRSPRKTSWQSIFLVKKDGGARIILPASWSSYRNRTWMAVQAGPRLVVDGHTARVHQNYAAARAGVCIQKDGDLTFFATPQNRKFTMYEIARIARRGEIDGGLECRDAMLFDGGHSVNFFAEGEDDRIVITGDTVPVFVYATPKE